MSFFNQLKNKAEELNKKHSIIPSFGQNHQPQHQQQQQQGHAPSPYHQNYPGQPQPQYTGYYNQPAPPAGSWQQPPPPPHQPQQQSPSQLAAYGNYYAQAPPPPIPYHSRPGGAGAGGSGIPSSSGTPPAPPVYWRPDFSAAAPVSHAFEHKLGHGSPYGWGNNELQTYTDSPANSFHAAAATTGQQILVVRAIARPQHPDPEARFTSARLVSRAPLGRASGCLTAALTLPCAEGVWPAFWLLPREPFSWPRDGEVDVAETWNGDGANRSCLHWGYYDGAPGEPEKHRVRETRVPDMGSRAGGVRFDFVWYSGGGGGSGSGSGSGSGTRLMWYIDGRPVMRNGMPAGARPIGDFCVLLNVAMGGNVCQGKVPREGVYDLVVHDLHMSEAPEGGWGRFEADWQRCPDGAVM